MGEKLRENLPWLPLPMDLAAEAVGVPGQMQGRQLPLSTEGEPQKQVAVEQLVVELRKSLGRTEK